MHRNSYNQVPYPKLSHQSAQARKLEAVATLFGMQPQRVSDCRVLELGCASGWNLIPQALEFPQSEFLGIDLSERQIEEGRSTVTTLGLANIELRQTDILNIDPTWGRFDYILCHGTYSWVPEHVQDKILSICQNNLTADGVALVSYNVLPGWHFRGTIRDMMLYHVSQFEQPEEKIAQARSVLEFMVENSSPDTAYGQTLREELKAVREADDQYLYHDHLEDNNDAIYFHQFVDRAEAQGLQYLGDTNVASMLPKSYSSKAHEVLADAPLVRQEQYLDFLRNNTFRSTLLCHHDVKLTRSLKRDVLTKFHVSLSSKPESVESCGDSNASITMLFGPGKVSTDSPLAIAILAQLRKLWPRSISLEELHLATTESLAASGDRVEPFSVADVAGSLLELCTRGLLEFYVHPPKIANQVASRPMASPLARLQAEHGDTVTNQRHENVTLDEFSRYVVTQLDSRHDRALLSDQVYTALASGHLKMLRDSQQVQDVDRTVLDGLIDKALDGLCQASLLQA